MRTFGEVFPHTSLWLTGGYLLLYGGLEPLVIDWEGFQQRFQARPPSEDADPADFLGLFVAARAPIRSGPRPLRSIPMTIHGSNMARHGPMRA